METTRRNAGLQIDMQALPENRAFHRSVPAGVPAIPTRSRSENNAGNAIAPRCARALRSKEKSPHIPIAAARESVSWLRDKKSRAKQESQRDNQCRATLW